MPPIETLKRKDTIHFREPTREDGSDVWELIKACEPLDVNSRYCNLIQCDHFAETCVAAIRADGKLVGWISAYLLPDDPQTLFVWQVAVSPLAQGQGVGKRMLNHLLDREACKDVTRMQTTITPDNEASWALFSSLARSRGARLTDRPHYRRDDHFDGRHETEHMVTIRFPDESRAAA